MTQETLLFVVACDQLIIALRANDKEKTQSILLTHIEDIDCSDNLEQFFRNECRSDITVTLVQQQRDEFVAQSIKNNSDY